MPLIGVATMLSQWPGGVPRSHLAAVIGGAGASGVLARRARRVGAIDRARALTDRRSRLPRIAIDRLEAALVAADVPLDAGAALQLWLLLALAAACVAGGLDLTFAPLAIAAVIAGGPFTLYAARRRGARRCAAELPVALELVAAELRTGGTVIGALETLGRAEGPLAAELARVNRRCALGAPLEAALSAWATERSEPGVNSAAGALAVAAATGGRAADALDGLASSLRDRFEIAAEGRALSAQARLSAIVIGSLPVVYVGACAVLDPRQVRVLTGSEFGLACLATGLTLEALAVVWIRSLLRQEP
jgi:tight adherence protein B